MKGGEYPYHPVTTGYMLQTMKKPRALFFFSFLKTILISSPTTPTPQIGKGQNSLLLLLLLSHFSRVQLCATPWTAAYQAPPSLGFSRQEHWSGLPFPSPVNEREK